MKNGFLVKLAQKPRQRHEKLVLYPEAMSALQRDRFGYPRLTLYNSRKRYKLACFISGVSWLQPLLFNNL